MTRRYLLVALALAAPAACSSSTGPSVPSICSPPTTGADAGACGPYDVLYAASDYSSSITGALAATGAVTIHSGVDLGADPALETTNGRAFFIARDVDTIVELDPRCGVPIAKFSVNDGAKDSGSSVTNPQDIAAAADGTLWVPRFNVPSVAVVAPSCARAATLDISSYDADGNPNASAIAIDAVGGVQKAFVALERLDDDDPMLASKQPSMMLRFDVASRQVEAAITLAGRNPFGLMREYDGALFLAEPGNFDQIGEPYAGVERFEVATSATALLVTESALGGSVAEVAVTDGCAAAIIADATPNVNRTALVTFDPTSGASLTSWQAPVLGPTTGFDLEAMTWVAPASGPELLLVGDRRLDAGSGYPVHVFERAAGTCALTERPDAAYLPLGPVAIRPTL